MHQPNLLVLFPIGLTPAAPFLVEVILFPHLVIDRMKAANNLNPLNPVKRDEEKNRKIYCDFNQSTIVDIATF